MNQLFNYIAPPPRENICLAVSPLKQKNCVIPEWLVAVTGKFFAVTASSVAVNFCRSNSTEPYVTVTQPLVKGTEPNVAVAKPLGNVTAAFVTVTRPSGTVTAPFVAVTGPFVTVTGRLSSLAKEYNYLTINKINN